MFEKENNKSKFWTKHRDNLMFSWIEFRLVIVFLKHLNFAAFSKDLLSVIKLWFCPALCSENIKSRLNSGSESFVFLSPL